MQLQSPSYFRTRIPTSHYQKERPAELVSAGTLATEDGVVITTENDVAIALDGATRSAWLPSVASLKDALRIPQEDTSEDAHLDFLLEQAVSIVEHENGINADAENFIAVLEPDEDECDRIKIDRSNVLSVLSVNAREEGEEQGVEIEFEVQWENGLAFLVPEETDARFPGEATIKIEYERGLTNDTKESKLFNAAVLMTAKSLYEGQDRIASGTQMRAGIFNTIKTLLKDRRSTNKWRG